jgi:ammonia channel protein AmtB
LLPSAGAMAWMLGEWLWRRRPSLLGLCSGVVAGLVAITPAAGFVTPRSAVADWPGIAGLACYWGATGLKRMLRADDSLDVFGVHGIGGIVGSMMTGLFATKTVSGLSKPAWSPSSLASARCCCTAGGHERVLLLGVTAAGSQACALTSSPSLRAWTSRSTVSASAPRGHPT